MTETTPRLTDRQRAALTAIAAGYTENAAARRLGISARTLRRVVMKATDRLGAAAPIHAVALAAATGILDTEAVRSRSVPPWPAPGAVAPPPCGTVAAYTRHRRRGETPDEVCRAAYSAAQREYRRTGSLRLPDGWTPPQLDEEAGTDPQRRTEDDL
jgi:DNA-binding CsgD family transcriptional regulator